VRTVGRAQLCGQVVLGGNRQSAVQARAQLAGFASPPVHGQQVVGQLRIAQQQPAVVVDEERTQQKCGFRRKGTPQRAGNGFVAPDEGAVGAREAAEVPGRGDDRRVVVRGFPRRLALEREELRAQAREILRVERRERLVERRARVQMHARIEPAEALPGEAALQVLALAHAPAPRECHHHPPAAVPGRTRGRVDMARRGLELPVPEVGETVIAPAAEGLGPEPVLLYQPVHRGAHQALRDAERSEQPDQRAEPYTTAVRRDRIAEHGDDQGNGADRSAAPERRQQPSGGIGGAHADMIQNC
jgi:hypothetical protein